MSPGKRIGFAVVGLGSISQVAVLPAFAHSKKAALVAVVSGRKEKAWTLALQFNASQAFTYDEFSECLQNPQIEAVYIATPPGEHEKYAVQAAKAGKHVISEKPLAASVQQARNMVGACRRGKVLFMTAYRKYFEPSTLMLKKMISTGVRRGSLNRPWSLLCEYQPLVGGRRPSCGQRCDLGP
jgi:predicted dehydrogenase